MIINTEKLRFALLYFKNGGNASATARDMEMAPSRAQRLKRDEEVREYSALIADCLSGAALPERERRRDIADMDEVLAAWSAIVRDEHKIEKLASKKTTTAEWVGKQKNTVTDETPEVVQLNSANSDIISAGKALYQYYRDKAGDGGESECGVVILAEIKDEEERG